MVPSDPWYADGLRFACQRCGHCCVGTGNVRVSDGEIAVLARRLGMSDPEFRAAFTRPLRGGEQSLRDKRGGECVFWDRRHGCTVYADRPRQCRTWPFWRAVIHSPERWEEEAAGCPGMNRGERFEADWIERSAREDGTSGGIR